MIHILIDKVNETTEAIYNDICVGRQVESKQEHVHQEADQKN